MNRRLTLVLVAALLVSLNALAAGSGALSLVPNDAVTVGYVKLSDMRSSPLTSILFKHTDNVGANGDAKLFLEEAGLSPTKDVDVLVVATLPKANLGTSEAEVLVIAEGRFAPELLTAALVKRGAVKKNGYLVLPEKESHEGRDPVVAFPSASLALAGSEAAVAEALAARAAGGTTFLAASGLGHEVSRVDRAATAWAVVDVARASRLTKAPKVPSATQQAQALHAAIKNVSTVALWATDTGDALKVGGIGVARDEETRQLLEDTIKGALAAMRLAVQDKQPEMVSVLRKFDVSQSGDTIQVTGTIPAETIKGFVQKAHAQKQAASMK